MELFGRIAVFEVGEGGGNGVKITNEDEGMRIVFEVEKTIHSDANKSSVQIYNLARRTRERVKKGSTARLFAGYSTADALDMLFEGSVTRVEPGTRQGPDIITTIECGDGSETFKTQTVEKTFPGGTSVRNVILAVAKSFTENIDDPDDKQPVVFGERAKPKRKKPSRLSVRNLTKSKAGKSALDVLDDSLRKQGFSTVLRRAMSVSGNAREVMDKLSQMWRFDWSVQDGQLQILAYGNGMTETLKISSETGMIGTPEETDFGCKFTSLILPKLYPGTMCNVASEDVSGLFRAEIVKFQGDTHEGNWTAEVEAAKVQ